MACPLPPVPAARKSCVKGLAALYEFNDPANVGLDSCANGTSLVPAAGSPFVNMSAAIPDPDPNDGIPTSTRSLHLDGQSYLTFADPNFFPTNFPRCDLIPLVFVGPIRLTHL